MARIVQKPLKLPNVHTIIQANKIKDIEYYEQKSYTYTSPEVIKISKLHDVNVTTRSQAKTLRQSNNEPNPGNESETDIDRETDAETEINLENKCTQSRPTRKRLTQKRKTQLMESIDDMEGNIDISLDEIKTQQLLDPESKQMIDFLNEGKLPDDEDARKIVLNTQDNYMVIENILYHIYINPVHKKIAAIPQLFIPESLRQKILSLSHSTLDAAHLGVNKMYSRLLQRYYWPGILKHTVQFCHKCHICCLTKKTTHPLRTPLALRDPPPKTVQYWTWDILGPLPPGKGFNSRRHLQHIIVLVCNLSKFVVTIAVPDIKSETLANALLQNVFSIFGFPQVLASDNGPSLASNVMSYLCKLCGIQQKFSMSYRPTSQAIAERANLSLITALKSMVNENHTDWPKKLPLVTMALNGTVHKSINQSAYNCVFGNEATFMQDLAIPPPVDYPASVTEALHHIEESRKIALDIAREYQEKNYQNMKARFDKKARAVTPVLNEIVYLHAPHLGMKGQRRKLANSYIGPFQIAEIMTEKAVRLRRMSDNLVYTKPIHIDRLKFQRETRDERKQ